MDSKVFLCKIIEFNKKVLQKKTDCCIAFHLFGCSDIQIFAEDKPQIFEHDFGSRFGALAVGIVDLE